jgi:ribosomal protein L40E
MVFGDIFKSLKNIKDEADKCARQQEAQEREQERERNVGRKRTYHNYRKFAGWIKENYGDRFKDGSTTAEVQRQLEGICNQLDVDETVRQGWRTYIERRHFGDLLRVSDPVQVPSIAPTKILCPKCKMPTSIAKFCENCGSPLQKKLCQRCGAENALTAKFCNNCGNTLG